MIRPFVRSTSRARALVALGGVALLAFLALTTLLIAGALGDESATRASDHTHTPAIVAVRESHHAAPSVHELHQQPSTRARSVAFGVLAAAVMFGAWAVGRVHLGRSGRPRTLRICGLPPGRAPPRLRIA